VARLLSGWRWGGDWTQVKDYMHFSVNGHKGSARAAAIALSNSEYRCDRPPWRVLDRTPRECSVPASKPNILVI
jgi:hypothetical protein